MKEDNVAYIGGLFGKICSNIVIKCYVALGFVIANFFVDTLMAKAMLALFFLIIFDWVTGVLAARKTGHVIKSSKIVRTPLKIAIYFMIITAARIAEFSLPSAVRYLDDTVIAFLTLTELTSVLENTGRLGYAIPKKLLEKLMSWRDEK